MTATDIAAATDRAFERFLRHAYAGYGGYRYRGRPDSKDPAGYMGPMFFIEEDLRFRFGLELEKEFADCVRLNWFIGPETIPDWQPGDGKQFIDLAVLDAHALDLEEDHETWHRFRQLPLRLMAEVKFFRKGWWSSDAKPALDEVVAERERLAEHVRRSHTLAAAYLAIDDEGFLERNLSALGPFPAEVVLLLASESELHRRRLGSR